MTPSRYSVLAAISMMASAATQAFSPPTLPPGIEMLLHGGGSGISSKDLESPKLSASATASEDVVSPTLPLEIDLLLHGGGAGNIGDPLAPRKFSSSDEPVAHDPDSEDPLEPIEKETSRSAGGDAAHMAANAVDDHRKVRRLERIVQKQRKEIERMTHKTNQAVEQISRRQKSDDQDEEVMKDIDEGRDLPDADGADHHGLDNTDIGEREMGATIKSPTDSLRHSMRLEDTLPAVDKSYMVDDLQASDPQSFKEGPNMVTLDPLEGMSVAVDAQESDSVLAKGQRRLGEDAGSAHQLEAKKEVDVQDVLGAGRDSSWLLSGRKHKK